MYDSRQSGGQLTLAGALVSEELVALLAAALKGAHCVFAEMVTAAVIERLLAFIYVCMERGREGWGGEEEETEH